MAEFILPGEQTAEAQVEEDQVAEEQPVEEEDQAVEEEEPVSDEALTVTIGGEDVEEEELKRAAPWVRKVRDDNRQLRRELTEVKRQLQSQAPQQQPVELGPRPTLEEYGFDTDKYTPVLEAWLKKKEEHEAVQAKAKAANEAAAKAWNDKLSAYGSAKASLTTKAKDFPEAEAVVMATLNVIQQSVIVKGAKDPSLVVYALGKNVKKAQELAAIADPVEFAAAIGRLEAQMKVNGRRPTTTPEGRVEGGSGKTIGSTNSTLEKLREKAAKTGDYTELNAYKAKLRASKR